MSTLKCKMCGGALDITENATTATCEYCGTEQTIPKTTNDVIGNLFNRANTLRLKSEFDKAEETYNKIIEADKTQAEAYWGVILCKYGIEYVEDPATFRRVPTCHRTSFEAITADEDYKLALQYADISQKIIYEAEAKAIDEIQRGILAISQNEKPYDVFICYKETDESGKRTTDSVIANDIYHQLTQEGFKVFYAAITLEDKLGQEYEPYIFAALNSAKVMLVIGSKPEYFTAVWVKNEWSRFMKLMKSDRSKLLIPCYKDMDAYELPEEFAHLQAQDMSKIGFINDIVRGIKKVVQKDEPKVAVKETVVQQAASMTASNASPLLKRAFMSIEDGEWEKANDFCEKALNIDPENAEAYLCKLMIELKCYSREDLKDCAEPFDNSSNYKKALRFADKNLKDELTGYINYINDRNENERKSEIYNYASDKMNSAANEEQFKAAAELFKSISGFRDSNELEKECLEKATYCVYVKATSKMKAASIEIQFKDAADIFRSISGYRDSDELEKICLEKAEEARKEDVYISAQKHYNSTDISTINRAIKEFQSIPHYKDSDDYITRCRELIQQINEKREKERIENERKKEEAKLAAEKRAKIRKRILITIPFVVALCAVGVVSWFSVISPMINYNNAVKLMSDGKYSEAISAFKALDGYGDSNTQISACKNAIKDIQYNDAVSLMNEGKYDEAISAFEKLGTFRDSNTQILACKNAIMDIQYNNAILLMNEGKYYNALSVLRTIHDYKNANDLIAKCITIYLPKDTISAGKEHTVSLKTDGTVLATGQNIDGRCRVFEWKDIIAVSAGDYHTVGLKSDGTVVAVGDNSFGQGDVSDWKDIIAISAGRTHTVGLKSDGTVVAVGSGNECNVSDWKDIIAVSAGDYHTVGLKFDGTVVAVGDNSFGQGDVSNWKDIIAVSAGRAHTVGLKSDGTVVAVGNGDKCNVSDWKDIIAVSAGEYHTVGLKLDGTVVAVGNGEKCNVSVWKDIIAVSAGGTHTVGLKSNGIVIVTGDCVSEQCNVWGWKDTMISNG